MQPDDPGPEDRSTWGRVDDDGTVYVKTADGERPVGSYPTDSPAEALEFFGRKYDALAAEVTLLEQRVRSGAVSPANAGEAIDRLSAQVDEAPVVGDLMALRARLDTLRPLLGIQKERRREDRARKAARARERKTEIAAAAEEVAAGHDWRGGVNRLRDLLEEWKSLPRIDKATDDQLWHRFSTARTAYTKARKAHFAERDEQRESARVTKQRLAKEAEALAGSREWGPTTTKFRTLMQEWKAAGGAPKEIDDELWARFRAAQDAFFSARDAANAAQDEEFRANAEVKRGLLEEAEKLLPVTDLNAAKRALRDIAERWDAAGKVPRDQIKPLESRLRRVEEEIRGQEQAAWRRSDPEKSARAGGMIDQLERAIADLEADLAAARERGDDRAVSRTESDLASRRAFLDMAKKAAADYSD